MHQSRTRDVGLEVHKASMAVAYVAREHGAAGVSLGTSGPRHAAIAQRTRQLPSKATRLVLVSAAGPCGSWRWRSLPKKGPDCWGVAPALLPQNPGGSGDNRPPRCNAAGPPQALRGPAPRLGPPSGRGSPPRPGLRAARGSPCPPGRARASARLVAPAREALAGPGHLVPGPPPGAPRSRLPSPGAAQCFSSRGPRTQRPRSTAATSGPRAPRTRPLLVFPSRCCAAAGAAGSAPGPAPRWPPAAP